jgi:hypothetical protein
MAHLPKQPSLSLHLEGQCARQILYHLSYLATPRSHHSDAKITAFQVQSLSSRLLHVAAVRQAQTTSYAKTFPVPSTSSPTHSHHARSRTSRRHQPTQGHQQRPPDHHHHLGRACLLLLSRRMVCLPQQAPRPNRPSHRRAWPTTLPPRPPRRGAEGTGSCAFAAGAKECGYAA